MANNYTLFSEELTLSGPAQCMWWEEEIQDIDDNEINQDAQFNFVDFSWTIADNSIVFYSEEGGSPYQVCELVHRFFKEHNIEDSFVLQWAETCSKPRIGEFAGGMCLVTKEKVIYFEPEKWVTSELKLQQVDKTLCALNVDTNLTNGV